MPLVQLICTVRDCRTPLRRDERRLVCDNAHSFDLARSGYVNLLQPQDRRSKNPGDTAQAVAARRRFMERGHADPLLDAVVRALPMKNGEALLDAGCGEGHHTDAFRRAYGARTCGVDISVPAIELAAKRYPECQWIVANADRFLPYADHSFDAVVSITARLSVEEFHRVLAPPGQLLVAIPGARDLVELREAVQGERVERDRVERTVELFAPRFILQQHQSIEHVARLDRESIQDVLTSTYRGLRRNEQERIDRLLEMDVTLARDLLLFRPA